LESPGNPNEPGNELPVECCGYEFIYRCADKFIQALIARAVGLRSHLIARRHSAK
jgi:hypothetical protein